MHNLQEKWKKLGVLFPGKDIRIDIDLEKTIIETLKIAPEHPRLLFGMIAWCQMHYSLISGTRLINFAKKIEETALLGALIDLILQKDKRSPLRFVSKYCTPLKKRRILFDEVEKSSVLTKINRKECLPLWKKWGYISAEMNDMDSAVRPRSYVLRKNPNLRYRALFGSGLRAELFSYLTKHCSKNASEISQSIGYSYEPVYRELNNLLNSGFVKAEQKGKARNYNLDSKSIIAAFS